MKWLKRMSAKYYGASARDEIEAMTSTSGGIASVLARRTIDDGGVVFGAAFDPFPMVRHICVEDYEGCERLKGSKYVESDIQGVFKQTRQLLERGRKVLFVGLPCQIAGLYAFLKKDHDNLITVDLICHGKPSAKLFLHFINFLERRYGKKIIDYWFRNKFNSGWNGQGAYRHYCKFADGCIYEVPRHLNWYVRYFLSSVSFKKGCYHCPFARIPRIGDITLGDFWGIAKDDRFRDLLNRGVSFVSIQSQKGQMLFDKISDKMIVSPIQSDFAIKSCYHLTHRSARPLYTIIVTRYMYFPNTIARMLDWILFGTGKLIKKIIGGRR